MRQRKLGAGIGTLAVGVVVFVLLGATGSLRHPATAVEQTHPAEFVAIGAGFLLLTVGLLVTIITYVEPALE